MRVAHSDLLTEVIRLGENALVQKYCLNLWISEAPQSLEVAEHWPQGLL